MISSVPSRCWEIARERISSSVITPPALRITCASPIESPRIGYGFRRASMQATIATFFAGGSGRSPLSKPSAKASLFFRNSSIGLISAPFGLGSYKDVKGDQVWVFAHQDPQPTSRTHESRVPGPACAASLADGISLGRENSLTAGADPWRTRLASCHAESQSRASALRRTPVVSEASVASLVAPLPGRPRVRSVDLDRAAEAGVRPCFLSDGRSSFD